jgi:hypothetical protein
VVRVEATATQGASSRRFRATADRADVLDAEGRPFVAGCILEDGAITDDGTIELTVLPSLWLDQLDLTEFGDEDDSPIEIAPGTIAHRAFVRGLMKAGAYAFRYHAGKAG